MQLSPISANSDHTLRQRLTRLGVAASALLVALKLWAARQAGSLAVLSDALNSLVDIFAYSALALAAYVQGKAADPSHPFGHRRAEPLASLVVAFLSLWVGGSLVKDGLLGLWQPRPLERPLVGTAALAVNIAAKSGLAWLFWRGYQLTGSAALRASFTDSRNDILASTGALIGLHAGAQADSLAGMLIGLFIIIQGWRLGLENLGYVMGSAPPGETLARIEATARQVDGVLGVHDVRAHYVGDVLHVEVHIEVPRHLSVEEAHDIAVAVSQALERSRHNIDRAFVHVDPT